MKDRKAKRALATTLVALFALCHPIDNYGALGKIFSKAVMARIMKRDLEHHAVTAARPLTAPRTVHRYTSAAQASRETTGGLAPNTHMTAIARTGRPPAAATAQSRYGLPAEPQVRETIHLPEGYAVRHNRVVGGSRGLGELTSPNSLPPDAIRKVTPLR